jgi:hypothetical protein
LFGSRFSHPGAISPALLMAFVSGQSARVATSASRPSMMARAWVPEPPCDWRIESAPASLYLAVNAAFSAR